MKVKKSSQCNDLLAVGVLRWLEPEDVQIVGEERLSLQQPQPYPREGLVLVIFLASRPRAAATWAGGRLAKWALLKLIILAGDIESNSGQQTIYICPSCNKNITHSQESIRCNIPTHWTHINAAGSTSDNTQTHVNKTSTKHPAAQHRQNTKLIRT